VESIRIKILLILLSVFVSVLTGYSQDSTNTKQEDFQNWRLRASPYIWFFGIKGTLENPPYMSISPIDGEEHEIDKSYNALKNSLKFGLSMNIEYNWKNWIGIVNFSSFIIQGDDITPNEFVYFNIHYRWESVFGEAKVGYKIISNEKIKLDGLLGLKLNSADIGGHIQIHTPQNDPIQIIGDRSFTSIDPIIAARFTYIPHYRIELMAYMDYGPFQSANELTFQAVIDTRLLITKWFFVSSGYKYWHYKSQNDEPIFNGQFYGFYFRFGAQF